MTYNYKIQIKTIKGVFCVDTTTQKIINDDEAKEIGIRELIKVENGLKMMDFRYKLIESV